MKNKGPFDDSE
jgi:hypothetical protein